MSNNRLKSSFRRHASSSNAKIRYNAVRDTDNEHLDEHSRLLSRPFYNADGNPLYTDGNPLYTDTWLMTVLRELWRLQSSNYINILLAILPFGLLSDILNWNPVAKFTLNFLAVIPLEGLLSYASGEAAASLGQILGGLLNTVFGSATELIVAIIALRNNEIGIVQASIMGRVFSNTVLTPGACFSIGGLKHREQTIGGSIVSTLSFPMLGSILALVAPTALYSVMAGGLKEHFQSNTLSLGCAVVLLILQTANLVFQLKTHVDSFDDSEDFDHLDQTEIGPEINIWTAASSLLVTLLLITLCAQNVIRSLPSILNNSGLGRTFIGFVLLPFLGSTAEQITSVVVTYKNRPDLALGICISDTIQSVLFVTPILVIIGSTIGHPMTVVFGPWEIVAVLFAAVLLTALLQRKTSTYLDGLLCLGFYSIVVIMFWTSSI